VPEALGRATVSGSDYGYIYDIQVLNILQVYETFMLTDTIVYS
jgi:hypothetical protein